MTFDGPRAPARAFVLRSKDMERVNLRGSLFAGIGDGGAAGARERKRRGVLLKSRTCSATGLRPGPVGVPGSLRADESAKPDGTVRLAVDRLGSWLGTVASTLSSCARRCALSFCAFSMCSLAAISSRSSEVSGGLSPPPMLLSSEALGAAPIDLPRADGRGEGVGLAPALLVHASSPHALLLVRDGVGRGSRAVPSCTAERDVLSCAAERGVLSCAAERGVSRLAERGVVSRGVCAVPRERGVSRGVKSDTRAAADVVAGCVVAAAVDGFAPAASTRFAAGLAAVAGLAAEVAGLALVSGLATLAGRFAPPVPGFVPPAIGFAPLTVGLFALEGAPGAQALGAAGATVGVLGSDCFCC